MLTDDLKADNAFKLSAGEGQPGAYLSASESKVFEGRLWVTGANAGTQATGIWVAPTSGGDKVTVTNKGSIYVTATDGASSYSQRAMMSANGATVQNDGLIVAKNAYGMTVGNKDVTAGHIINNGSIYVETQGAAIELGGAASSTAVNNGQIYVAAPVEVEGANPSKFAHGVLIQDQQNGEFTNAGLIQAAEGASAIEIKGSSSGTVVNLVEGSNIEGAINVTATGSTTINAKNVTDTLDLSVTSPTTEGAAFTFNVLDNSNITLADGNKATLDNVTVDGARLNASIWADDNTFNNVDVTNGGIFNVTKLNSGGDKDDLEAKPHDQLLFKAGSNFEFNGGKLYVDGSEYHGKVKVGSLSAKGASLTLDNGSYSYSDMTVGSNSTFTVGDEGDVTLANLLVFQKVPNSEESSNVGGTVNVFGHLTVSDEITFETADAKMNLDGGTLTVGGDFLFTKAEGAAQWSVTDVWKNNVATKDGLVEVTDSVGDYTITQLKAAQALLNGENDDSVQLVFLNGSLQVSADDDLTADNVDGLYLADNTVKADKGTASFTKDTTAAAIDFQDAETTTAGTAAISTGDAALTLSGNSGDVFSGLKDTTKTVAVTGSLTLGTDSASSGTVNVENLTVSKNLTVIGSFKAQNVELTGNQENYGATISGDFDVNSLKGGKATVENGGVLTFNQASTAVTLESGAAVVIGQATDEEGKTVAQIQGSITAPSTDLDDTSVGAVLTTNRAAANALIQKYDLKGQNLIYVDDTLTFADGASINFTDRSTYAEGASVTYGEDTVLVVNASKFIGTEKTAFDGATLTGGEVILEKVTKTGESFKLASSVTNPDSVDVSGINIFVGGSVDAEGVLTTNFNEGAITGSGKVEDGLRTLYAHGMSVKSATVMDAIGDEEGPFAVYDEATDTTTLSADGVQAVSEYLSMPVVAGTYNMAYDAAEQVTGALTRRNLEPTTGLGVWADVFYASNEAKTMYGDSGYDADMYGYE